MGKAGGEVLWIGISSHKRRMWLFPHPYCPLMQWKTVQAKGTGLHESSLLSRCSQHKWEWLDLLSKCPLQTFWQITLHFLLFPPHLGKRLLDYCFASQLLSCWTSSTQSSLTPHWTQVCLPNPVTHLPRGRMAPTPTLHMSSLGHMYLLWNPDTEGQAREWWWVLLSQSCTFSMLTPHLQHEENSYLLSLCCKDKKKEQRRAYNTFIFTNNFQV